MRRQNALNGRGGRAEPKDRVALLCLVVYSIAIHARPPVLSIKASAMVRAWAVSSMVSSLHDRRVENKFHAARSISQSDCSVLCQGDTCMEIGLSRRVAQNPAIEIDVEYEYARAIKAWEGHSLGLKSRFRFRAR